MTLRERIKALCKKNGISINKLEIECGFAKGYVSKLDKSTPNSENIQKMANYFGVTVDYLMTGEEPKLTEFPEQAELLVKIRSDKKLFGAIEKYYALNDKKKEHVLDLIDLLGEVSE